MALVIGSAWLAFQGRSVSVLAAENAKLRERVEAGGGTGAKSKGRDEGGGGRGRVSKAGSPARTILADPRLPLDWKGIEAKLVELEKEGGGSPMDNRFGLRLGERLEGMGRDELVSALGEIEASGMPLGSRKAILGKLLDPLMAKDPEWTLTRYLSDRLVDSSSLANAFDHWATRDLAVGMGWFDARIAEGMFDGKSPDMASGLRLEFEGKLLVPLLAENPEQALARLEAVPESQRGTLLRVPSLGEIVDIKQKDFVAMLRKYLPEGEVGEEIVRNLPERTDNPGQQGSIYERVSAYLDGMAALPKERGMAALEIAENEIGQADDAHSREMLGELRSWIETQAPGKSAGLTGIALAAAISDDFTFEQASALVVEYDKSKGSQEGLVDFLKRLASPELQAKAMPLVNGITDEAARREILKGYQPEEEE